MLGLSTPLTADGNALDTTNNVVLKHTYDPRALALELNRTIELEEFLRANEHVFNSGQDSSLANHELFLRVQERLRPLFVDAAKALTNSESDLLDCALHITRRVARRTRGEPSLYYEDRRPADEPISATRFFSLQYRVWHRANQQLLQSLFPLVALFLCVSPTLEALSSDAGTKYWAFRIGLLLLVAPFFVMFIALVVGTMQQHGVHSRNTTLLAKAATLLHNCARCGQGSPRLAVGALMATVITAEKTEPIFLATLAAVAGVASAGEAAAWLYYISAHHDVSLQVLQQFNDMPLQVALQQILAWFFTVWFLLFAVFCGWLVVVSSYRFSADTRARHNRMADREVKIYNKSRKRIRYIELDEDTLSKCVENAGDPKIRTLADYMEVNDVSHPKTQVLLCDTGERGEVQQEGCWSYEQGTIYPVRLAATGEVKMVDGSQLRMIQAMVQAPAQQFSKPWDPERDEPIDFFVTHSWTDDTNENAGKKMKWLLELNNTFQARFQRPVRVWYEKFCIPQGDYFDMDNCDLLPVFIACSRTLLCMHSLSWRSRLWCLSEASDYVLMSSGERHAMLVCDLDGSYGRSGELDVGLARCGNPADEVRLRQAIAQIPHNEKVALPSTSWARFIYLRCVFFFTLYVFTGFGFCGGFPDFEDNFRIKGGLMPGTFEWLLYFGQQPEDSWLSLCEAELQRLSLDAATKGFCTLVTGLLAESDGSGRASM
jgi:hypothetical protein